jgi:hypothetical protein
MDKTTSFTLQEDPISENVKSSTYCEMVFFFLKKLDQQDRDW